MAAFIPSDEDRRAYTSRANIDAAWWNDGHEIYAGDVDDRQYIGDTCNLALGDRGEAIAACIVADHNDRERLLAEVGALLQEIERLTAAQS